MTYADLESSAAALYDGGWRKEDKADLIREYQLSEDEAEGIVKFLEVFERR